VTTYPPEKIFPKSKKLKISQNFFIYNNMITYFSHFNNNIFSKPITTLNPNTYYIIYGDNKYVYEILLKLNKIVKNDNLTKMLKRDDINWTNDDIISSVLFISKNGGIGVSKHKNNGVGIIKHTPKEQLKQTISGLESQGMTYQGDIKIENDEVVVDVLKMTTDKYNL